MNQPPLLHREQPTPPGKVAKASLWRGVVPPFLIVLLGMLLFRSVVLDWNVVPSGSMRPTIVEGDYIFVNKLAYDLKFPFTNQAVLHWAEPARGEIVVFTPPGETERFVKRIVGGPGDVLEMRDNVLFVNGEPAAHQPLERAAYLAALPTASPDDHFLREAVAGRARAITLSTGAHSPDSFEPIAVPPGHYFVMGDNRDNSKDSRYFGPVARERIVGRSSVLAASLDPAHGRKPRWERFLRPLN